MQKNGTVQIEINEEAFTKAYEAVDQLNLAIKNELISLTKARRRQIPKIGKDKIEFVKKVINYATDNPEFVSPYMDIDVIKNNMQSIEKLDKIYRSLIQVSEHIDDTNMSLGSTAYTTALAYYQSVKVGVQKNAGNAKVIYDDLKRFFSRDNKISEEKESNSQLT